MAETFKPGDLVYCPELGNEIYSLRAQSSSTYPLIVSLTDEYFQVTVNGLHQQHDKFPSIHKATEANCKSLCTLYGSYFVSPREHLVVLLREHFKHNRTKVVIKTNGEYFIVSAITSDAVVGPHSLSQFLNYIQPYSLETPFLIIGQ